MSNCWRAHRVGVIRTLSHGYTLKEQGPTGWVIDLTVPGLHKTSRCYGPQITPVSSLVVPSLEKLIEARKGDGFDFVEEDEAPANRTSRQYLFHTSHSTRCYDSSAWTKRVKAAFQRFSPSGTATPPRLLRSAFVTALRSDPDCPREILESAAIAMKHSVATQKASYDLEAQLRLTEKAFAWAEQYAQRCDSQQDIPMEEVEATDEGVMPIFDDDLPPEDSPVQQSASNIHITAASTPADMAALLEEGSTPSAAVVRPLAKSAKRKGAPSTPAGAPSMASLKNLPRAASQKKPKSAKAAAAKAPKHTAGGDEEEYTIDRIIGASLVDADAAPSFYLEWEGHNDVSWQQLDSLPSVAADADTDYMGYEAQILKMGSAYEVLQLDGARPRHKIAVVVIGGLADSGNSSVRVCHEATGTVHMLDMHSSTLDGMPMDWLLSRDRSKRLLTDAIIVDWDASSDLAEVRAGWDNGKYFPSLQDMRTVLKLVGNIVVPSLEHVSESLQQRCLDIAVFLDKPEAARLPIITGCAQTARDSFLDGGLIRDCFTQCASLEEKNICELSQLVQSGSVESAVSSDGAGENQSEEPMGSTPEELSLSDVDL